MFMLDANERKFPDAITTMVLDHLASHGSVAGLVLYLPRPFRGRGPIDIESFRDRMKDGKSKH